LAPEALPAARVAGPPLFIMEAVPPRELLKKFVEPPDTELAVLRLLGNELLPAVALLKNSMRQPPPLLTVPPAAVRAVLAPAVPPVRRYC
jgi:hypothetical protein